MVWCTLVCVVRCDLVVRGAQWGEVEWGEVVCRGAM